MIANPIRVLVVEDSPLMSEMITRALESDPQLNVIGVAREGAEAIEMVQRLKPDLVTMDIYMPNVDGYTAVEQIMAYNPTPILVITASAARADLNVSVRMLAAGALDVMEKPSRMGGEGSWGNKQAELVARAKLLAQVSVVTHLHGRHKALPLTPAKPPPGSRFGIDPELRPGGSKTGRSSDTLGPHPSISNGARLQTKPLARPTLPPVSEPRFPLNPLYRVVAIASSTGGPLALLKVLRDIPANFPAPILVVQHIASGFIAGLAEWLDHECKLPVRVARDGQRATAGVIYLAPDDVHLLCNRNRGDFLLQTDNSGGERIRPAADMLFRSVAESYGPRAIGVILTGMGRDGADGLKDMRGAGAYTIAQDEATSAIFGMPKVAISIGAVSEVLAVDEVGQRLVNLLTLS